MASWWAGASRRIHLLGKGVLRFHAVYWPAMLAAGPASAATTVDLAALATETELTRSGDGCCVMSPRTGDTEFTVGRLIARANDELANGIGKLVRELSDQLEPFRPEAAARIALQCTTADGCLPPPVPVFARLATS